jgi:hypothetical protein
MSALPGKPDAGGRRQDSASTSRLHFQERVVVEDVAGFDDGEDLAQVADVCERVGLEDDEIGEFAGFDCAHFWLGAEDARGIARGVHNDLRNLQ